TPPPPPRSGGWGLLLAGCALATVVLLAGAAVGVWFLAFRAQPGPENPKEEEDRVVLEDLQRVPDDALAFVSVRLGDWWGTPPARKLRQEYADAVPEGQLDRAFGVPPDQVRHLILVVPAPEQFCLMVRTKKPYDRQEVTRKVAPNAAERRHEGRTYLADGDTALHFAGDQVYYLGNLEGVHRLAAGPGASGKGGPLDSARRRAGR